MNTGEYQSRVSTVADHPEIVGAEPWHLPEEITTQPRPRSQLSHKWRYRRNWEEVHLKSGEESKNLGLSHTSHVRVPRIVDTEVITKDQNIGTHNPHHLVGDLSLESIVLDRSEYCGLQYDVKAVRRKLQLSRTSAKNLNTSRAQSSWLGRAI